MDPSPSTSGTVAIHVEQGEQHQHPSGIHGRGSARRRCATSFRALGTALSRKLSTRSKSHWILLFTVTITTLVALVASSLLPRSYYRYGSSESFWVISWFTSVGWPLLIVPLLFLLPFTSSPSPLFSPSSFVCYPILGLLTAVANSIFVGIYALPWGWEFRNGTDESLISSFHGATTTIFAALFGFCVAKNKMGAWRINAVVVVAIAALLVAYELVYREEAEKPTAAFVSAILILDLPISFLRGFIFALTERILRKRMMHDPSPSPLVTARIALEVQLLVSFFAFGFSCIGFFVVGGFEKTRTRGMEFEGGKESYYMILSWSAVAFQVMEIGGTMLVGFSSTLLAGILSSFRLPVTALVAIAFFPDVLSSYKVFGMLLAVWGFACYGFGNLKH